MNKKIKKIILVISIIVFVLGTLLYYSGAIHFMMLPYTHVKTSEFSGDPSNKNDVRQYLYSNIEKLTPQDEGYYKHFGELYVPAFIRQIKKTKIDFSPHLKQILLEPKSYYWADYSMDILTNVYRNEDTRKFITENIDSDNEIVRRVTIYAAGKLRIKESVPKLILATTDKQSKPNPIESLLKIKTFEAKQHVLSLVEKEDKRAIGSLCYRHSRRDKYNVLIPLMKKIINRWVQQKKVNNDYIPSFDEQRKIRYIIDILNPIWDRKIINYLKNYRDDFINIQYGLGQFEKDWNHPNRN